MHGRHAWLILAGFVVAVDLAAIRAGRPTMSEALDTARNHHPAANAAILAGMAVTVAHLSRTMPRAIDPFRLAGLAR